MEWYYILGIVIAIVIVLFLMLYLMVPLVLVHYISYPKRIDNDTALKVDIDKGLIKGYERWGWNPIEISMEDGYRIHGSLSIQDPKKFVIFAHGYTWTKEGQIKYAQIYGKLGYSLLLYDERSHGKNIHEDVTMGYKEAYDLHQIIQWVYRTYGQDIELGIMGESMGGATVLQVLQYHDKLKFVHADCPYSSLRELCSYKLKQMHLPQFLLRPIDYFLKKKHGYHLDDVKPEEYAKDSLVPLLLTTGHQDAFVPFIQCQYIYDSKEKGYKELHYFEGAEHAQSYETHPETYEDTIRKFLDTIAKKENCYGKQTTVC